MFAAERLAESGFRVSIYDRMPSLGRKFLMAGRGGLNLTHAEPMTSFMARYGAAADRLDPMIKAFPPSHLRAWADGLGAKTFIGSSGRVFPAAMKASPLLRAWLGRLNALGVAFHPGHTLTGLEEAGSLCFRTAAGERQARPDAVLLACGGASWPRLGSDGSFVPLLAALGISTIPFSPSNAGVLIDWSIGLQRHAGTPLKRIALRIGDTVRMGEAVITRGGLEGGLVYALSAAFRAAFVKTETASFSLDLRPEESAKALAARLLRRRPGESLSTVLKRQLRLSPASIALLHESGRPPGAPEELAQRIKAVPLKATAFAGLDRAISSAGGVSLDDLDDWLMLKRRPGIFLAGEMLDWDAPTGGYLLQASFATAHRAAEGVMRYLGRAGGDADQ